jgi:hypothetical protein
MTLMASKPRLRDTKGRFKARPKPLPPGYVPPIVQGRASFPAEQNHCLEAEKWIVIYDSRDI